MWRIAFNDVVKVLAFCSKSKKKRLGSEVSVTNIDK